MNTTGKKTEIQESGSKIRTWRVTDFIARTAELLIGYRRPFHYDGDNIEFDASEESLKNLLSVDKYLEKKNEELKFIESVN